MIKFGVSVPTGREGLMVPTGFASKDTIVDAGKYAETLGYYSVWGNDHVTTQNYIMHIQQKPSFYDPLISLAAIAAVTEKVKLATGILVLPWRTPSLVILAKQLATLDVLSNGRLIVGVGTGAYREESSALHIRNRKTRFDEGIQGLRALFEKPRASFNGKYIKFTDVELYPKPIQNPLPIFIGQHRITLSTLDRIARYAQGWIPGISPEQFKDAQVKLRDVLRTYNRALVEIELVREISVSLAKTREKAIEKYRMTPAYRHLVSLARQWRKEPASIKDAIERALIGTADDIIERIQRYIDVNVTHFMINFAVTKPHELRAAMKAFANEVRPSFVNK
ncbi:MAG: TIGR03619 family F420-dependent LLM class oxidoreductase [Candidatus Bathyarchaeota archaeon]|nr:MAG: TIGR03619 family F420-dependent LLM class oxidoreductase [Candidatus Bathyarchaeota archaeon]